MPFCCVLVAQIPKHLCLLEVSAFCYAAGVICGRLRNRCGVLQADRELMLRRSLPSCSPRALAAARILCAGDEAELAGRTADALGRWKDPVSPINEVRDNIFA